jgi:hypothetical protein
MRRIVAVIGLLGTLAVQPLLSLTGFCATTELHLPVEPEAKLRWNPEARRMSASIESAPLRETMAKLGGVTGWRILLDPTAERNVSVQFTNKSTGEALRMLLGNLNFAVVPETPGPAKLLVFKNEMRDATQLIAPAPQPKRGKDWLANEIIVTLRKGSKRNIDELARQLGAKVVGRNDKLGTYRLQFDSDEAAEGARQGLDAASDLRVDDNYALRSPDPSGNQIPEGPPNFNLKPNADADTTHTIVAVVDTAVQALDSTKSPFLLQNVDVAGPTDPRKLADATPLHGTSMVETLLGSMALAAQGESESNVRILPVNVYGNGETTTTYDVTLGVYEAVTRGANIVNLSLGGDGDSPLLDNLIAQARKNGVLFFAAAGNVPTTAPTYPAANPMVYAVTAADRNGQIASYANTGSFIDLIAPGTSYIDYTGQTFRIMGTSPATATVSGYAATALAQGKSLAEVQAAIAGKFGLKR